MTTFMNILSVWILVGTLFLAVFFASEGIAFATRADYRERVMKSANPNGLSLKDILLFVAVWFFAWPIMAVGIIVSMLRGHTVTEALVRRMAQEDENVARAERIYVEGTVRWLAFEHPEMAVVGMLRTVGDGSSVCTHVVLIPRLGNRVLIMRAMPDNDESLPYHTEPNTWEGLEDAFTLCQSDREWGVLCMPGMEKMRRRVWRDVTRAIKKQS